MDYQHLDELKKHPAWRLLKADNAPFIVSFFHSAFLTNNIGSYLQSVLVGLLDDHRHALKDAIGESFPRSSQDYLDEWAKGDNAYLRKYYPERGDEPNFELMPSTEMAIDWLAGLKRRPFVGTESRLMAIFQLLRDIVQFSETDPAFRMAALEKRRLEIDKEIERLKTGRVQRLDPTRAKERYFQLEDMVRRLFADFRQVEENFRELDRRTREKIALSETSKGQLLDEIFSEEHAIADSDEGRSFRAFWEFLLSPARQEELRDLTDTLLKLDEIQTVSDNPSLPLLKFRLMDSGVRVKRTLDSLVDHLRRFLDDRAWIENRRIMDLIHSIEKRALDLSETLPDDPLFTELDELHPELNLTMARGLARPMKKMELPDGILSEGMPDFESDLLYNVHHVDEMELRQRIQQALENTSQISLDELCLSHPLTKGLSELVTYLHIASRDGHSLFDENTLRRISWKDSAGLERDVVLPQVIFLREEVRAYGNQ